MTFQDILKHIIGPYGALTLCMGIIFYFMKQLELKDKKNDELTQKFIETIMKNTEATVDFNNTLKSFEQVVSNLVEKISFHDDYKSTRQ